ncbi:RHS repeat domain-containing protein, partial [Rhizobacter sp. P5_C2]
AGGTTPHERFYDLSGRVTRYRLGNVFRDVTYDAADRIISFTHLSANDGIPQPALDQSFGYDENDRITQVTTLASSWSITYDPNGNRTGVSLNGSPSVYNVEATSNRLASITNPARSFGYDNAGNTITDNPNYTATYGLSGSLASITKAGVTGTYSYDADKRRIRKVTSAGASSTVIFVYGLNGELLGEYDQNGAAIREYVWLDDIPVAMFMPDPTNPSGAPLVFYIHADHLNAPRLVVDMNDAIRWRWFAEPFGTTAPEVNPSGLGAFTQHLRFPGQYADAESGLWYNYFRYYAPDGGAYRQSDPIGLDGGINTYAYSFNQPTKYTDPLGLQTPVACANPVNAAVCAEAGVGVGAGSGGAAITIARLQQLVRAAAQAAADAADSDNDKCNDKCKEKKAEASAAFAKLVDRLIDYLTGGSRGPDAGHLKAIGEAQNRLQNELRGVERYCRPLPPQYPFWRQLADLNVPKIF